MGKVVAIDFDGCLCESRYPDIGPPNWDVIYQALEEQRNGAKLILWTCREGPYLNAAVMACMSWGLTFDAVNENLPELIDRFGNDSRKVTADEYWDDHAVRMDDGYVYDGYKKISRRISRQRLTGLQDRRKKDDENGL